MKLVYKVAAIAALVSAMPAAATVVTSLPGGTLQSMPVLEYFGAGPQVFGNGITWSSTNASNQGGSVFGYTQGYGFDANGSVSGFPLAGVNSSNEIYGVADTMTFDFATPVSGVGGITNWAGDNVDVTIAIYDASDNLLESYVVANSGGNIATPNSFIGFSRATADISKYKLSAGYIAVWDLTTTGAAVPEPASWALMIAGFGLTGAAMRRRRSVVAA
jgi:PEP-CTERM motif